MYGNFFEQVARVWSGYPGGYRKEARSSQPLYGTGPFMQSDDPNDIRSKIPALGHREYWYLALPNKDVKGDRPQVLSMDLVFFRGKDGAVRALLDACPHRGAYLSLGDCFYKGFITCPYHGATYDGDGNCVAMLTEGPDSKLPGEMRAWPFPTVTANGIVFVWMGEGEPVDPREDLPPEMFEDTHIIRWACQVMHCNWILALENTNDAHNAFFVHRNCIRHLGNKLAARPRTPLGYRTKIVGGKTVNYSSGDGIALTERYYYDANGHIAYQMYYPGVDGVWPLHRYRLLWSWMFEKGILPGSSQERAGRGSYQRGTRAENALNEWQGTRLPSIAGKGTGRGLYVDHRWAVPVERDMTRMVYLCIERFSEKPSAKTRFLSGVTWPWRNWTKNFNFRYADLDAERTCQYDLPEYLSATDSTVVVIRKVLAEYARGVRQPSEEVAEGSREEELVTERNLRALESSTSINAPSIKEGLAKTGLPGFSE